MALKTNTPVGSTLGIDIQNAYIRVTVIDGPVGNSLQIFMQCFASLDAFEKEKTEFLPTDFDNAIVVPYDRAKDGVDTLAFGHQKAIEYLATKGIDAVILLDSLI